MVCVANELAQMLYKFFSRHTKQPAFNFKINMDKERATEILQHLNQLEFEFSWFDNLNKDGIEDSIFHILNSDSLCVACNRVRVYISRYFDDLPF